MNTQSLARTFIKYLEEQKRYDQLPAIVAELQKEVQRNQDISIISAAPLSSAETATLEKQLQEKWGEHRLIYSVDPSLLSGLIIAFQNQVIDMSSRHSLKSLKENLHA